MLKRWAAYVLLLLTLAPPLSAAADIKVAALNLLNYSVGADNPEVRAKHLQHRDEIAEVIARQRPQVLVLCELSGPAALKDLKQRLAGHGLSFSTYLLLAGPDENRQLGLLSNFNLRANNSLRAVPLEFAGRAGNVSRGVLDVVLEVSREHALRVVGLHLKSKRQVDRHDPDVFRAAEARAIRKLIESPKSPDAELPTIVAGDLNDHPGSRTLQLLRGARGGQPYLRDVRPLDDRGHAWTHYYSDEDTYARIDYLLYSGGLKLIDSLVVSLPHEVSDHRLLLAEFELEQ